MATNDAFGQGLQSAVKIWRQTIFVEKIMGIWSPKHNRQFPYEIYDYSIEKSHTAVELLVPGQIWVDWDRIRDTEQILD